MASRLVVEWTRATLRLALSEGQGDRFRLRAVRSQPLGPSGIAGETIRSLLGKRPPAVTEVIGVIPREQVITRLVKFPSVRTAELASMVELYAKAQLPYPREQALFDFHVVSRQEGFSNVAIIACQRDVVDRLLSVLREAQLQATLVTVGSWGVLAWYQRAARPASSEPCLVMNVDDTRTDLVLISGGKILSSRSVGQGADDWELLADSAELLALEIDRSRAAIRKELPSTDVRSFLLTGLGPLTQWSEQISKRLAISLVSVDSRQHFPELKGAFSTPASSVVVGGLACSTLDQLLNLNPVQMRADARHRQQVKELTLVTGLLAGVMILGSGLLMLEMGRAQQQALALEQALKRIEPAAKDGQQKSRSIQIVNGLLEERRRLAAMLSSVFQTTPTSITLEVVNMERAKQEVTLRGSASSTQEVLGYVKQLGDLADIDSVQLKYATARSTPSGERTDFELSLRQREEHS